MENKEILHYLRRNRDISAFAKYIGISPQGLYKLLSKEDARHNQFYNLVRFLLDRYRSK